MKRNIQDYKPIDGFFDLRNFELPEDVFLKLWKIQEFLKSQSMNFDYFKRFEPIQLQKLQNLSAEYQQILFSYKSPKEVFCRGKNGNKTNL